MKKKAYAHYIEWKHKIEGRVMRKKKECLTHKYSKSEKVIARRLHDLLKNQKKYRDKWLVLDIKISNLIRLLNGKYKKRMRVYHSH